MYTIRLQRLNKGVGLKYKIVVILKGAAVQSQKFKVLLGYYNKDSNQLRVDILALYHWLGRGATFSNKAYHLLGGLLKI